MSRPIVAICYDFDGTLSPKNMQEYGFFLGLEQKERKTFWKESNGLAKAKGADQNLMYMKKMIDKAKLPGSNLKTTRSAFQEYGKTIDFYPGVKDWFSRINQYGRKHGVAVKHYIISSGLKEMVEGSEIGKFFTKIYACTFLYDTNDVAEWPAQVVNCTSKKQYLFRINKGIEDDSDTVRLNEYVKHEDRPVPFSRMIYVGDGTTDIPCMRLVKEQGGFAIGVYKPKSNKSKHIADKLFVDGRVNFIAPADYTDNSVFDQLIKRIIDQIQYAYELEKYGKKCVPRNEKKNADIRNCDFQSVKETSLVEYSNTDTVLPKNGGGNGTCEDQKAGCNAEAAEGKGRDAAADAEGQTES